MKIEALRGLVRPVVTFAVIGALVGVVIYLAIRFGDADITKLVVGAFLSLVSVLGTFWFVSRNNKPTDTK